jgi:hypothetical protein
MVDWNYPKTVDQAVERLVSDLPLKNRVYIANLAQEDLYLIHISLRSHIGQELGLWSGNKDLIESCRAMRGSSELRADQCPAVILEALWRRLQDTHTLRPVEKGMPPNRLRQCGQRRHVPGCRYWRNPAHSKRVSRAVGARGYPLRGP